MEMLEVENLTKIFGGLTAVDSVSFEVEKNSIFGLIGPNGAGKTTFFNMISGVFTPTSGKVFLEHKDITGMLPHRICGEMDIARTYQNINLFEKLTVRENVLIGFHKHVKSTLWDNIVRSRKQRQEEREFSEKCMEILDFMEIADKGDFLAKNLSYGDQRRVEIARALATNPKLLLLDEPAAGMNTNEKLELAELIQKINAFGITILLVEHDMRLVMNITRQICVLNFGKKIAFGTPSEIQNNPEVIKAYLGGSVHEGQ